MKKAKLPEKIGEVKVEKMGEHLIKLIAPPIFFARQLVSTGKTPDCLWRALVEIQKIRKVSCIYRRDEDWRRACLILVII